MKDSFYDPVYLSEYVDDNYTEAALNLQMKAESVHLDAIGADTTYEVPVINDLEIYTKQGLFVKDKYPYIKRWLIAQALFDNISVVERGLSIRWLMPDLDFTDSYGDPIKQREWWVPANGKTFEPDPLWSASAPLSPKYKDPEKPTKAEEERYTRYLDLHNAYAKEIDNKIREENPPPRWRRQTVLETNRTSRNDRKIIILFGAGLGHDSTHTITSIEIRRSYCHTIRQIISTENMPDGKAIAFEQPFLAKRSDSFGVIATLPQDGWQGKRDKLILYGFVAEALGTNQMG